MANEGVDLKRRRFLTAATTVVGGVGAVYLAVPFVASMQPSARAKAAGAPVEADISKLEPGQMRTVEWRGVPVWIVRRTEQNLNDLPAMNSQLRDPDSENPDQQPDYCKNINRSIKAEYLIAVGICTHLGCSPSYHPEMGGELGADWKGGFFCPCHGSRFDLSGRVFQGVPAPTNLRVPPHHYLTESRVLVGLDEKGAA